jgi:hypothetical protein
MTKTGKKSTGVFDSLFYPVLNNILWYHNCKCLHLMK